MLHIKQFNKSGSHMFMSPADTAQSLNSKAPHSELPGSATTTSRSAQSFNTSNPDLVIRTAESTFSDYGQKSDEDDDPPQSVIHAPSGFGKFENTQQNSKPNEVARVGSSSRAGSDAHVGKPLYQGREPGKDAYKRYATSPISPPPLMTTIAPTADWTERATPRAQTMEDFEKIGQNLFVAGENRSDHLFDSRDTSEVGENLNKLDSALSALPEAGRELRALKAALAECWSLCNTLASLGDIHTSRSSWKTGVEEETWQYCWKLCQELYHSQDVEYASQVTPILDLSRKFCQTLFDTRVSDSEAVDSVLRVSFELNNHLYNMHDRNLPEAFGERTLDFYITLCHRLMKQRGLSSETDALLGSCWSLTEMLFSIRQSKRYKTTLDEELLGSAVQACWELCDLFREGWARLRFVGSTNTPRYPKGLRDSDRGTPRPDQATFHQSVQHLPEPEQSQSDGAPGGRGNPETPTTIFEETTTTTPDDVPIQNIFLLGQGPSHASRPAWSPSPSDVSGQTGSSNQTSSADTVTNLKSDSNILSLKVLITKAAMNGGFQVNGPQTLSSFVKSLSSDAFGSMSWQVLLLKNYKKLVAFDPMFRTDGTAGQASAIDIANAVQIMTRGGRYIWLRDLYRLVLGFQTDEALNRQGVILQA